MFLSYSLNDVLFCWVLCISFSSSHNSFGNLFICCVDVDVSFLGFLCPSIPFIEYTLSCAFVKKDIFLTPTSVAFLHEHSAVLSLCLVVMNCQNLYLSWNITISPSTLEDNFSKYRTCGSHVFTFRAWNLSFFSFLVCIVIVVVLTSLPLYGRWHFPHTAFRISLFYIYNVITLMYPVEFLF